MLRKVTFDEYSIFYGYSLHQLTSFNVFLGRNNSGKTAVLDYIYQKNPQNTNYLSGEEFIFLYSDKSVNVPKDILRLRKKSLKKMLQRFEKAEVSQQQLILKYFHEMTGLDIDFHHGRVNHFVEKVNGDTFYLDFQDLGSSYLSLFAFLVEMIHNDADIILIDEPEMSLHSNMQKKLHVLLKKYSRLKNKQIFIATHSHLFLDRNRPKNNFKIKSENNHRTISQLNTEEDIFIAIYQMLGNSPADIFMPSNFILVEGPSDKIFLVKLMQRFYHEQLHGKKIVVQTALGDITNKQVPKLLSSIEKLYKVIENNSMYADRSVILVDSQQREVIKKFIKDFDISKERLRSLGEIKKYALEESYPPETLKRLIKKGRVKISNPHQLMKAILKNKKYKKVEWAKRVGDEIRFEEIPQIFKDVIETAIKLSL